MGLEQYVSGSPPLYSQKIEDPVTVVRFPLWDAEVLELFGSV